MDYAALPPEINSARMYSGAGATPMMAAAAAWNGLAAELSSTATSYQTVISTLTGDQWRGAAATAMAAAVRSFVAWLHSTAGAAEHAAAQAMASAAAYEAAFAMTVPPPVVTANRSQLATLVATNILGINAGAIAALEALYAEMWAQDAAAMYSYAAASASAGILQPLRMPAQSAHPVNAASQAAGAAQASANAGTHAALSQAVSSLPAAVQALASPVSGSAQAVAPVDIVQNLLGAAGNIAAWEMFAGISAVYTFSVAHPAAMAAPGLLLVDSAAPVAAAAPAPAVAGSAPVLAGVSQAASVGGLSVPPSWPAAVPHTATSIPANAATVVSHGWTDAEQADPGIAPGMPVLASAERGDAAAGKTRYGFKPTVMTRPVVAG